MNDYQLHRSQLSQALFQGQIGYTVSPPPARIKRYNTKGFVVVGVLIASLVCIGACVGIAGLIWKGLSAAITEQPKVASVIDAFMSAMTAHDIDKAYGLFSTRAKRNVSYADIEKLRKGQNLVLFDGYQSVTISDFTFNFTSDPDPEMPQGQVVLVEGMVSYSDGFTGEFSAVLEKEGEEWRIYSLDISVPPAKFSSSD